MCRYNRNTEFMDGFFIYNERFLCLHDFILRYGNIHIYYYRLRGCSVVWCTVWYTKLVRWRLFFSRKKSKQPKSNCRWPRFSIQCNIFKLSLFSYLLHPLATQSIAILLEKVARLSMIKRKRKKKKIAFPTFFCLSFSCIRKVLYKSQNIFIAL